MIANTHPFHSHATFISQALPSAQLASGVDVAVTSCTNQSTAVRPGDAFVVCQNNTLAADIAREAVERGATAVIAEQYLPVFGVPQYLVDDASQAYSELCNALLGHPGRELNPIAIAGTHGKTSIAMLVDSIFNMAKRPVATATNQFTRVDGECQALLPPTTAPAIADFVDEALASGCRQAVVELDEQTLHTQAASAIEFDVVCLANMHGDSNSPENAAAQREQQAMALDLLSPQGMAVLNADDPNSMRVLAEYDGPALTFGLSDAADITALVTEQYVNEQTFVLICGDESAAVRAKVVGETHVQNCLAAAAIAKVYGISLTDIVRGIERVTVIPGVMHRFDAGLGVSVFVDRGNSAIARSSALKNVREVTTGDMYVVVDHQCVVTDTLADRTIATSCLQDCRVVTNAVARVLAALEVTNDEHLRTIVQKLGGVAQALLLAEEGDTVVVSGWGTLVPNGRRATTAVTEEQLLQSLMYEIASEWKRAA
ncbi:Mur ligase family protein [Aeoliella mucimassa]|uniref:MurE-like ligase n=1 Tax=Aeoliella mucimassa TaxID=2527972 RepID=A0A518AT83_9BACT|nr:Mur ligase family protein [Aeoliella mucimassa]QDU57949.1 MurE-like ligase [Aeoliella mucimassa]